MSESTPLKLLRRTWIALGVIAGSFVVILVVLPATLESRSLRTATQDASLDSICAGVAALDVHTPFIYAQPESESLAQNLKALAELLQSRLDIRRDADAAASWGSRSAALVGLLSTIVIAASIIGGYSVITNITEQAKIRAELDAEVGKARSFATEVTRLADSARSLNVRTEQDANALRERIQDVLVATIAAADRFAPSLDVPGLVTCVLFTSLREASPVVRSHADRQLLNLRLGVLLGNSVKAETLHHFGFYYRSIGDYGTAVTCYEDAIDQDASYFTARIMKALLLGLVTRNPACDDTERHELLCRAFTEGLYPARSLATNPDEQFSYHFVEGWLLDEVGRYDEAVRAYLVAQSMRPLDDWTRFNIACSFAKAGRGEDAILSLASITDPAVRIYARGDADVKALLEDVRLEGLYGGA